MCPCVSACSIQKIGMLLAEQDDGEDDRCVASSGGSMPPSGHVGELLRTKKYAESSARKIIASVVISTTMPHHAVG